MTDQHEPATQRRPRFRLRRRGDRGSVAVEAALVLPALLLLVVGILEFGLAFKDQLAVTSAVRAGARIAAAEPRYANFATDAANAVAKEGSAIDMTGVQALWVYQADTSGHPVGAGGAFGSCNTNCIKFVWNSTTHAFVKSAGTWAASSQNACQGQQDSIGVYLKLSHSGVTTLIFSTLGLDSYTVMRLEPIPTLATGGCK
jgi:hypothetical protein